MSPEEKLSEIVVPAVDKYVADVKSNLGPDDVPPESFDSNYEFVITLINIAKMTLIQRGLSEEEIEDLFLQEIDFSRNGGPEHDNGPTLKSV